MYLCGAPISWICSLQKSVALSSVEAEYMALSCAARQIIWLRQLLKELFSEQFGPTFIGEDNQGAIHLVNNPSSSRRTRHINVRYHFTRDAVINGQVDVRYVPTDKQPADILTKYLSTPNFLKARELLFYQQSPPNALGPDPLVYHNHE